MNKKPIVLGICTANRCRSQMFEAILKHLAGEKITALSAGTKATFVHPLAIKVLKEIDVPVVNQVSKKVEKFDVNNDKLVLLDQNNATVDCPLSEIFHIITLCGGVQESCPIFLGEITMEHWPIDDPDQYSGSEEDVLPYFRASRDDIYNRIQSFIEQI